jgi:hypothetical protein
MCDFKNDFVFFFLSNSTEYLENNSKLYKIIKWNLVLFAFI